MYSVIPQDGIESSLPQRTERIFRKRVMLRLGLGLYQTRRLNSQAMELARSTFSDFHQTLIEHDCTQVCAVATSALREAQDGTAFIQELEEILGHHIQVITGQDEARLIAAGVLAFEPEYPQFFASIDIGGGSTEISIVLGQQVIGAASIPLGAIRCQEMFLKSSPPEEGLSPLRTYIKEQISSHLPSELSGVLPVTDTIGSSGTIRALGSLQLDSSEPQGSFSRNTLRDFIGRIQRMNLEQICTIPEMERNRADIILAGSVILDEVLERLGAENVRVSLFSLRHGLLAQQIAALDRAQS